MLEISVEQVSKLKGAPLAVMALLANSPQPVTQRWLTRLSGYTDKPVRHACQYLQELGIILHTRAGWFMLQQERPAPLTVRNNSDLPVVPVLARPTAVTDKSGSWNETEPAGLTANWDDSETGHDSDDRLGQADMGNNAPVSDFDPQPGPDPDPERHDRFVFWHNYRIRRRVKVRNISESGNYSDPYNTNNSINLLRSKDLKNLRFKDLKNLRLNTSNNTITQVNQKKSDSQRASIWKTLEDLGINHNLRTEALVKLAHITPEYIRAIARKLEKSGRSGLQHNGLLIRACEDAWPVDLPAHSGQSVEDKVAEIFGRKG